MYTAIDVAKNVVNRCIEDKSPITNLQLQKIMFYIQKKFLSFDTPLFDEDFEAWRFGPVIPSVYYLFCGYGAMAITDEFKSEYERLSKNDGIYIWPIVKEKREIGTWKMVQETHRPNGAWAKTYNNGCGYREVISKTNIKIFG